MTSEGMWALSSAAVQANHVGFGIIVLESGRVFGGDGGYYFLGEYAHIYGEFSGRIRVRNYVDFELIGQQQENVFGMKGVVDYVVLVKGQLADGEFVGSMQIENGSDTQLPFLMRKISDLP